ncbi:unnamed protein product [Periconia digitata]|uniref:Uncharacterized protein n=1 Tax=Periconia digitata TaxID=1303443 RepID=A0A9W4XNB2_9PLEO|nr:unnamed protein product [Periconia digitata]
MRPGYVRGAVFRFERLSAGFIQIRGALIARFSIVLRIPGLDETFDAPGEKKGASLSLVCGLSDEGLERLRKLTMRRSYTDRDGPRHLDRGEGSRGTKKARCIDIPGKYQLSQNPTGSHYDRCLRYRSSSYVKLWVSWMAARTET